MRATVIGWILVGSFFPSTAHSAALRECPKCLKPAFSDEWSFCPFCGTKLPVVIRRYTDEVFGECQVVGNIYLNRRYAFSIERPSLRWNFITDKKQLEDLNADATIAMELGATVYSMVIIERLPGVPLMKYADLVAPDLDEVALISDKEAVIHGIKVRKRVWRGKHNGLPFRFFYTLIARGEYRFQIVSWCAESVVSKEIRNQIEFIENSFNFLSPAARPTKHAPVGSRPATSPEQEKD